MILSKCQSEHRGEHRYDAQFWNISMFEKWWVNHRLLSGALGEEVLTIHVIEKLDDKAFKPY